MIETPLTGHMRPNREPLTLREYEMQGGYAGAAKALKSMTPDEVLELVTDSGLRGRGGAGFPTGQKWSFVPRGDKARHPTYLIANADEMEPGSFKDRWLMEAGPHQLIEGIIVAAYAIQADVSYIFLRDSYRIAETRLQSAMAEAVAAGYLGESVFGSRWGLRLHLHTSAGRYICGEETALINSLEGRRATPRNKPPFPQVVGLFGKPTIVQNVETLSNLPHIVNFGADWFKGLSRSTDAGTKIYTVSGKVKRPGAWELPMGTTIREVIEDRAGGMRDGLKLRALQPGGGSTDFLGPDRLDLALDFDSCEKAGSRLGTGTMVVLDDKTCPVGMTLNLERFFARESCG